MDPYRAPPPPEPLNRGPLPWRKWARWSVAAAVPIAVFALLRDAPSGAELRHAAHASACLDRGPAAEAAVAARRQKRAATVAGFCALGVAWLVGTGPHKKSRG